MLNKQSSFECYCMTNFSHGSLVWQESVLKPVVVSDIAGSQRRLLLVMYHVTHITV